MDSGVISDLTDIENPYRLSRGLHAFSVPDWSEMFGVVDVFTALLLSPTRWISGEIDYGFNGLKCDANNSLSVSLSLSLSLFLYIYICIEFLASYFNLLTISPEIHREGDNRRTVNTSTTPYISYISDQSGTENACNPLDNRYGFSISVKSEITPLSTVSFQC